MSAWKGPSPRVRGSPYDGGGSTWDMRSIPACAGEPSPPSKVMTRYSVHPRVCGGAMLPYWPSIAMLGPSPRVRGSPSVVVVNAIAKRSIPACAGEPSGKYIYRVTVTVHPRVCGGAAGNPIAGPGWGGPSPRVRGSHRQQRHDRAAVGSIPACAGEPKPGRRGLRCAQVHPRVCGGARIRPRRKVILPGPSPRVRGSLLVESPHVGGIGSIPACAGEPSHRRSAPARSGVHPRVCGGALAGVVSDEHLPGPSPRVRGSLPLPGGNRVPDGSIPACAGEPAARHIPAAIPQVHPRVCGGAVSACLIPASV